MSWFGRRRFGRSAMLHHLIDIRERARALRRAMKARRRGVASVLSMMFLIMFGSLAAAPLGFALAAPLAGLVGVSAALWIVGLGALTVLVSIIANPSVRALRAFPDGRDPAGPDSHDTLPAGSVREP